MKSARSSRSAEAGAAPRGPVFETGSARRVGHAAGGYARAATLVALVALSATASGPARAVDLALQGDAAAQWYLVESPFDDPALRRRRTTELVGFTVFDLTDRERPRDPRLTLTASLRLDSDFGISRAETSPRDPAWFVPGLETTVFDVVQAYVEGRDYLGGRLAFRVGRQQLADALGWWSFDGAWAEVSTGAYFALAAYGGLEERGGLPVSTSRYEADGVYRGDRAGMRPDQWPAYLEESEPAPGFGVAVRAEGPDWLTANASFREVFNRDTVVTSPFPDAAGELETLSGARVSTERVGGALGASRPGLGGLSGALVYDLYAETLATASASLEWVALPELAVSARFALYRPTFDGDSIWNWFARSANTSWLAGARLALPAAELSASGGVRLYDAVADTPAATSDGAPAELDGVGTLSLRTAVAGLELDASGVAEVGDRGQRAGLDFGLLRRFAEGRFDAGVTGSAYRWRDPLRPSEDAVSVGYTVTGGFELAKGTRLRVDLEQFANRLVGQQFRLVGLLDVRFPG